MALTQKLPTARPVLQFSFSMARFGYLWDNKTNYKLNVSSMKFIYFNYRKQVEAKKVNISQAI